MSATPEFFAHTGARSGGKWEPLKEHLQLVAERARYYAVAFGGEEESYLAGLLHDLGKYADAFLQRLQGKVSGLDHWSQGMIAALDRYRERALAAALAIQGHHIGLQEGSAPAIKAGADTCRLSNAETHPLGLTLTEPDRKSLIERFEQDGFELPQPPPASLYDFRTKPAAAMLDARMLFSALVDADFIETEAHFEGQPDGTKLYRAEGPRLDATRSRKILLAHIQRLQAETQASDNVRGMRAELFAGCTKAAGGRQGLFTLTAPTGAGKTLAMLEFALRHAEEHPSIRRIVLIIPFLSIIEQTATVYRDLLEPAFGPDYVLEHHSLADVNPRGGDGSADRDNEDEARRTARLLSENWDAPIILTTSVQFFESLFASRPGKCRKLHRLANSVILFDEVQTLPRRIAVPSLAALSRLVERYGCTVVFSTATQPAFDRLHEEVAALCPAGWRPKPIVGNTADLFSRAKRVRVEWRVDASTSWDSIADELATPENARSLCVVNLKRHAQKLAVLLKERDSEEGLFHLSTSMCPAHRECVLADVRKRLDPRNPLPCRLISTQCIEAGVDVDFPVAYRAFGPLDAIAQVAGRCNREGRLNRPGRMVVFLPEKEHQREHLYPPGGYKAASETTLMLIRRKENDARKEGVSLDDALDMCDPELFNQYYRYLYVLTDETKFDPERHDLDEALVRRSFVDVAKHYCLIDRRTISVLVPYADEMPLFDALREDLVQTGRLTRRWIQKARPLTINLYRPRDDAALCRYLDPAPLGRGEKADDWFIYLNPQDYDPLLGLKPPDGPEAWMI